MGQIIFLSDLFHPFLKMPDHWINLALNWSSRTRYFRCISNPLVFTTSESFPEWKNDTDCGFSLFLFHLWTCFAKVMNLIRIIFRSNDFPAINWEDLRLETTRGMIPKGYGRGWDFNKMGESKVFKRAERLPCFVRILTSAGLLMPILSCLQNIQNLLHDFF